MSGRWVRPWRSPWGSRAAAVPPFRGSSVAGVECLYSPGLSVGPSRRRASPEFVGWQRHKAGPSAGSAAPPAETRCSSSGNAAAQGATDSPAVVATGQPAAQNRVRSTASNTLPLRRRTGLETTADRRDRHGAPTGKSYGC
jgi:hypothetical protein